MADSLLRGGIDEVPVYRDDGCACVAGASGDHRPGTCNGACNGNGGRGGTNLDLDGDGGGEREHALGPAHDGAHVRRGGSMDVEAPTPGPTDKEDPMLIDGAGGGSGGGGGGDGPVSEGGGPTNPAADGTADGPDDSPPSPQPLRSPSAAPRPSGPPPGSADDLTLPRRDAMSLEPPATGAGDAHGDAPKRVAAGRRAGQALSAASHVVVGRARRQIAAFLKSHRADEVVPDESLVVIVERGLVLKRAFLALREHGAFCGWWVRARWLGGGGGRRVTGKGASYFWGRGRCVGDTVSPSLYRTTRSACPRAHASCLRLHGMTDFLFASVVSLCLLCFVRSPALPSID